MVDFIVKNFPFFGALYFLVAILIKSRSEQAPKNVFHSFVGVTKVFMDLWDLLAAI